MKDEYIVNRAICQCKFGSTPGFLKVTDNQAVCMNGKLAATDKTLGNVFEGAGFTMCKKSWPPKPCVPAIVSWAGAYDGVSINGSSSPLLGTSKGTCVMGCTDCITFQTSGQIPIPNERQVMKSAMALRNDINPLAVDEPSIVTYHIYWDGRIEKHIPKAIQKGYEDKYKYVYHKKVEEKNDNDGKNKGQTAENEETKIDVCILSIRKVRKRGNGKTEQAIPKDLKVAYTYPKGGNAQEAYIDKDERIYVKGTHYGIKSYPASTGMVELVRMPDGLSIKNGGITILFTFSSTQRRYCNPDTMAGFIGALAEFGKPMKCTGMCFADATSYPSLSHPNGDSADTEYCSSLNDEQKKVNAFIHFHFTKIFRGKESWFPKLAGTKFASGHETHLHAGDFDISKVTVKKL